MEPEDLPWPGELEEEEEEEEGEEEEVAAENLDEDEVVMVEDVEEEERRELDADFNFESPPRESTDDEEDEEDDEAKAWLQAHPGGTQPPPLPKHRYSEGERTGPEKVVPLTSHVWQQSSYQDSSRIQISDSNVISLEKTSEWGSGDDERTESWHFLPQEVDSSHTLDTTQTRFNVREEGTEVIDFPSVEEGILTQSENQVKEHNRDLFCSPLLVIQDSFASPDLPLLTCLTQDQEFGPDSIFHQSEPDFAPLRGIPGKSEDTKEFSRPSEVSEALFRASSEIASHLVNSHFSVSQHTLIGSAAESQGSFLHPEQGTKEETISSDIVDKLKTPKDSGNYGALCSYMSWKTQVTQEPETNLADKDQFSFSTTSDTSDEYVPPKESDSFDASCSNVLYWEREALQQSEQYLTCKDHDSCSDSPDIIDKNKILEGSYSFSFPFSFMPWSKQGALHHPETCLICKDHVSFPHELAPHFHNKMSSFFLHCLLERRGKRVPLMSDSHYFESVYLKTPAEDEVKQKMISLEGYERNKEGLGKELSQCFELKNSSTSVFSEVCPRSSEIEYIENVVVPDNSVKVLETHILSRGHDISKGETSGSSLQIITSSLDETSEQLYFQEERNQKASAAFDGKNVDATENVAFEAVIASIEPSKKESTVNEIQTDISISVTNDSQESEPKNSDLFLLNYNDENSFFDKLSHPRYQSTPGVFEPAASELLLHKKDDDVSSLYWLPNVKSLHNAPQEMFIKPCSFGPELKSSAFLSEKSHCHVVGLCKTQSVLFQCDVDNESFLPIGKIKSVSALDLAEKSGSSNIIYPVEVSSSDSLFLQDLKQQTFEEVADSSGYILGKNVNSSHVIEGLAAAVESSFSANLVAYDAKSQGALPVISDASLIAVGQETFLKADIGLGEIPQPMGAKPSFRIHVIMQNDSYFVEDVQGKAESDIYSLDDDTECCSLDENAVVCSKRSTELQREIYDQGDLTGECSELAGLENLLDDLEFCDISLPWESPLQLSSKEETVGHSDMDISQSFSSVLPPFVPHEPTRELEYHSSDLRMLRVSPEIVPKTLKHLSGDIPKGATSEITQSNLKTDITATSGDSGIGSHLPLSSDDFSQLAVRSSVENIIGLNTDTLNQQISTNGNVAKETLKVSAVSELADQNAGISTVPFSSYSLREKPNIFYPQALKDSHLTEEALRVSAVLGPAEQKTNISTVPPGSYLLGEKHRIFYQQALPHSNKTEQTLKVSFVPGPADQSTAIPTVSSTLYSHGEKTHIFYQQTLPESLQTEQAVKVSAAPGSTEQKTGIPIVSSTYSHREKPSIFYQQELPESHLSEQSQQAATVSGFVDQKTRIPTGTSISYSHGEKLNIFYQQELSENHLTEQSQQAAVVSGFADQKTGIPTETSISYSHGEKPSIFYQQELPENHLTEQSQQAAVVSGFADQRTGTPTGTSISYSHREKPHIFYQQTLPESLQTEHAVKVSAAPGSTEQKTGIPIVSSTYSHREKPSIFYQQELPESHLSEQSQQAATVSGFSDQKIGIPTGTSTSYSLGEKPSIFYQQELPESHLSEQFQQAATVSGLAYQKTGIPTGTSISHSHGEKPSIFYQQELSESHLTDQSQQAAVVSGFADQKTGTPTGTSISYSHREKPHIFYQQTLPESLQTEHAVKVSAAPGSTEQKTGIPIVSSTYSHREKPSIFYQQELPESHLSEQFQQAATVSEFTDQKTGIPTGSSTFYLHGEKPSIFYQQELPENHLTEQSQQAAVVSGFADQRTGTPTGTSISYSHREKPHIFYQQTLPESLQTEHAVKVSAAPGSTEQKTGIPIVSSTYSHREKPSIFYQQELPESHLSEQSQQAATVSGFIDQKTGIPTGTSTSYSHGEKPHIFYQQALPESHLTEQALKVSAVPGLADQKSRIPTVTSTSFSHGEKPNNTYQQELPISHLTKEVQKVPTFPGLAQQKTGIPVAPPTSYSVRGKTSFFYQKDLPDSHLTEQAQRISSIPGPGDQNTGIQTVPYSAYSQRETPIIFYQQEFPDGHLTDQALKVSSVLGPAEQNTGIPSGSSGSHSFEEEPIVFYEQALPNSHLTEESLNVSSVPRPGDQKTGILTVPSSSNSHREKPNIFYQQEFADNPLTEQAQKVSTVPGPAEQKTGIPTVTSAYSHREKPFIFYPQGLTDSHLPEEALKVIAVPGLVDQKTGLPSEPSSSYSHREKPNIFYQQEFADRPLTEQAQKVSTVPGPAEQKTGIPTVTSTYSHREKPFIFYPQGLTDSHLPEEALKVTAAPGLVEQKTGLPSEPPSSYSHREKPNIFYQQEFADSPLTEQAQKVSTVPGPAEQKTGIPTVTSTYSHREKPFIFYPQEFADSPLTEQAQKVSTVPGPAEQKTGIPTVTSTYSHREKPFIFYPQGLTDSHLPEEALKVIAVPGLVDQKTGLPSEPSSFYSHREKPIIFYPQALPDTHLTEEALKVSTISGPADQKTEIPTLPSTSYPHREKYIISPQALPDSHLLEEALKVSTVSGLADQKTGLPSEPPTSYSQREKPVIFYPQTLTESHLSEEAVKVSAVPGPADQKTGLSSEPSSFYSHREKSSVLYQQELPDSNLTEEALKVSAAPGTGDQKTGISTVPSSSYSLGGESIIFYQPALPDRHLTEEAMNVSASPGPADQKAGLPTVSSPSYSHREKPFIFYPQALADGQLTEETLKVSAVPLPGDQKTGIPVATSTSYSNKEKPIIFYQQALPDSQLTVEALKVSTVPEPGDQNTRKSTVIPTSYSHREKPIISYQEESPSGHLSEEALKVSGVPGTADQKTEISTVLSGSYSYREKPIISYQQDLTKEALKVLGGSGPADQNTGIPVVTSTSYSPGEKPIISYQQELPDHNEDASKLLAVPGPVDQKTGIRSVPSSYSHREGPIFSYQKELPDITEKTLEVSAVPGPTDQKTGIQRIPSGSYSHREKGSIFYQQELPDTTGEALKVSALPGPADQKTEVPTAPSSSYSHKEKPKILTMVLPDDQKTELPTAPLISYSHREKPKNLTVIGPSDQQTPLLTVFRNSYSQRVKPSIFFKQHLPGRHHSEDIVKISSVSEPTDVNSGIPIPLSSSYSHREKSNIFYPQELPDKHLTENVLMVSTIPEPDDQKTVLPTAPSTFFSYREKPNKFYQQDLPDRRLTQDALKFSNGFGQADQITGLSTVHPGIYSHSEKHKLVSDHAQRLIDNLDSSNSSIISNNRPLNSQAPGRVVIHKPQPSGFEDVSSEGIQDTDNGSKTLKEIQALLMEAENIALKRCNFPAPLVPFRDVSDISFIQSKKVVCFKEPPTTDESNVDLPQRQPFTEENPSNKYIQKDISTQTNLKCQRGIENWEFISSTTVRSPLREAESNARAALDETLRQYKAARSVMRSEPEGYSGTLGDKILIPMMTIIKSDSSSDVSSCSWESNSVESVSDVFLNLFPYTSPKTSMTDSREEEGVSESDDGCGSSVDSLAAHVKNLLKCESSLNHAKQILRNAEEEECRVRARAWNLKFNMARESGYSISELNEDDRRKVEEIKAKLFGHERTDLSKGLQSPRGIGCKPDAVCSHIIIESHEKGCFKTLTAKQPQLDSHSCVFRSAEPLEIIRGQRSPSSWRTRHINLSKSLDQSNTHFKVWNSLQLQGHSPFQNFTADDFKISKGLRMPFRENMDPWLSELVEPTCVPPEEMDCNSSSQMMSPESMKKFTTSITFSSHRHSKCFSDSSVFKVGVTEDSQCTGASVGVFNSHFTEEQSPPRDLKQETCSPSSFKIISHSPDKAVTILAESTRQGHKLSVEHSHQEDKILERSDFKSRNSEPSTSTNCSKFKEVHFSDDHTLINMGRTSSTLGVKETNVIVTPNPPPIFFEQSKVPHADHYVRIHHSPPPQHQHHVAPNLPCHIFLEKRELFEQSKTPHVDHQMRENHSPLPQGQDYIASDLPSSIFLEQRQLFEQSKAPDVDYHMRKQYSPLPQGQDYVVENNDQHKPKSHISNINVETKFNNVVSQSAPNQYTLVTSPSTPPSNRKALSCVRITLSPKTPSKLDSGTIDKRFLSLDPASKTRTNSEFNSDLQTISSRSLEPTSKLLTSIPVAHDQESLGFLGPKSSPDFQVIQSLPDSNTITQDLKIIPFQNSQIVTSRQTQVNFSDLEEYSNPEGTPVSADRSLEKNKPSLSAFSGKLSSDAVTQITTESPGKTMFSSEIFINAEDNGHEIPKPSSQKLGKVPVKFASSSSVQQITVPYGTNGVQPSLLPYKPSGSTKMYYVPQLNKMPSSLDSKSDTTIESSHSGSNDAIAPDFPAQVLGTRDDDLGFPVNIKHKEGIYSKRAMTKASLSKGKKTFQKDNADTQVQVLITGDDNLRDKNQKKNIYNKKAVTKPAQSKEIIFLQKDIRDTQVPVLITGDDNLQDKNQKKKIYNKKTVTKPAQSEEIKFLQKDTGDTQVQVLITGDDDLRDKNQIKKIYNIKAVTKPAQSEEIKFLQKDTGGYSDAVASELSSQLHSTKVESLPDTKAIEQKEEIQTDRTFPKEDWSEDKESLQIDIEESSCHSEFENTTHSVFRSAKFYFHHPVHLPSDQDFCHESLGRSVFMRHSWNDFFQHHSDKQHISLSSPCQNEEKTKTDYTRIESLSINVNLENEEELQHLTKSQASDHAKCDKQINDQKEDLKVTPEPTAQHITSLNELWNKYQERQKQQKPLGISSGKELSLVERLDRLAKLLQNPITHSLRPSESTQDDSRGQREWSGRQQQQKNKLQKKKRYKSLEKCHKNIGDLKKSKVLSTHQAGRSNQIKIEQVKFDKYVLRKQPGFCYINNTSSDSRPSEDSELLTDTATNILSTTASPVESDILTQTDKEVTLHERSSSISTIDTARLIQAFGHERVCLSPRRIRLYSSITDHQRRYIEKRSKKKKALSTDYPQMTSEHTRRKRIQVVNHMISSDSISSSASSFWSSSSTLCNKQSVHMLNKGVQAGNLEIVNGVKKHTRDVGVIFPTPSSSEARVEEDSDVTSWSEEKVEEKRRLTSYLGDKKLRKNKQSCYEGVSWFVPVEHVKSDPKKENLLKHRGPGVSWFAPVTNTKPWREPLREQNWQGQHMGSHGSLAGPGRSPLKPLVKATLQESLQLHRPDFISRSGERIKRLKLIVQERKLQNVLQSEREALFNTVRECQGHRDPMCPLPKRGFLAAQKYKPVGKKEMIQRSKRIYEQLPEVQKKREEEKRRLEYKTYRLRAQLYKKKVTNQLLGRKVPWD